MLVCWSLEILHVVSEEVLTGWSEVQVAVGGTASCIDNKASETSNKTFFDTGAALGVGSFLFLENLSAYNYDNNFKNIFKYLGKIKIQVFCTEVIRYLSLSKY